LAVGQTGKNKGPAAEGVRAEGSGGSATGASVHVAGNHEVETFSGRYVNTGKPSADTIALEDIAHALAHTCRFGGHCDRFYSVAEHAVRVSNKLITRGYGTFALAGLHHDDAEAYLGDIPRPLKPLLGDQYRNLTDRMDEAIAEALGGLWNVSLLTAEPVRWADEWMLRLEALSLLPSKGEGWTFGGCPWRVLGPAPYLGWSPAEAESQFLVRHRAIRKLWTVGEAA
jgi:hypothetical protein